MIVTVKPMKSGAILTLGLPKFEPSVSENITAIKINTPTPSANAATGMLTTPFWVFGKILHQIAEALLTALISAPLLAKKCATESAKNTHSTAPASTPPASCAAAYTGRSFHGVRPLRHIASVTAGLKCALERFLAAYIAIAIVTPQIIPI